MDATTAPAPTATGGPSDGSSGSGGGLDVTLIVGIVVGALVAVLAAAIGCYVVSRKMGSSKVAPWGGPSTSTNQQGPERSRLRSLAACVLLLPLPTITSTTALLY